MKRVPAEQEPAPVVARIGGLPADAVDFLASPVCASGAADMIALERELEDLRPALIEGLFAAVNGAPSDLRQTLLAAKRDVFNGRGLAALRTSPLWAEAVKRTGAILEVYLDLELRVTASRERLEASLRGESERQVRELARLLVGNPGFLRGLALAGPLIVEGLRQLAAERCTLPERRRRKLVTSLIRYVSRGALKLSPNSTLTRLALGATTGSTGDCVSLSAAQWSERSLLRMRRIQVDQWCDLLKLRAEFRQGLRVALNETVREVEQGRFRWLRPGRWEREADGSGLRYVPEAQVTARLGADMVREAWMRLQAGPILWRDLAEDGPTPRASLERLLELGFLDLQLPWAVNEPHAELQLLIYLRRLPNADTLECVRTPLGRLIELQLGFARNPAPEEALREMGLLQGRLRSGLEDLFALAPGGESGYRRGRLYEDVLLTAESGRPLVNVSRAALEGAMAAAEPLMGLSFLYNRRHDFLGALAELASRRFPHRPSVPFLDLFEAAQTLFQGWGDFVAAPNGESGWRATFNPFGLEQVRELEALRGAIWEGLESKVEATDDAERLSAAALRALLRPVPQRYQPIVGLCLFLQPLDRSGEHWMLNRLHEGVGRYSSRYTSVMDDGARESYTEHLVSREPYSIDGQTVELLDLMCPAGDTLNVHSVQTRWVLDLEGGAAAPDRRLALRDLRVTFDGPRGLPWLCDAGGSLLLAAHLGGASHVFTPAIAKFLALFGAGEFRSVWPPRRPIRCGEAEILRRLWIESLVLGRRRWSFPLGSVQALLGRTERATYVALERWRQSQGLPHRLFVLERTPHRVFADRFKPQYLDLTSPLAAQVLRAAIESADGVVSFDEVLPDTQAMPAASGHRWAVELLVDSLALRARRAIPEPAGETEPALQVSRAIVQSSPEPIPAHF